MNMKTRKIQNHVRNKPKRQYTRQEVIDAAGCVFTSATAICRHLEPIGGDTVSQLSSDLNRFSHMSSRIKSVDEAWLLDKLIRGDVDIAIKALKEHLCQE